MANLYHLNDVQAHRMLEQTASEKLTLIFEARGG